jgi:hypothetical protein
MQGSEVESELMPAREIKREKKYNRSTRVREGVWKNEGIKEHGPFIKKLKYGQKKGTCPVFTAPLKDG